MHLLRSQAIGTEVIDNIDHHIQGKVADLLIDADRAKVIALLVHRFGAFEFLALQTQDIETWGNRIHIRDAEVIGELSDFVRLESLLQDPRTFIGQRIRTERGQNIGRCIDVQLRTDTFDLEWIFPSKFYFWKGIALPVSEIIEVKPEAIIIKNQGPRKEEVAIAEPLMEPKVEPVISTPAAGRSANRYT